MKRIQERTSGPLLTLYRMLAVAVLLLGVCILLGTLYAFFLKPAAPVPSRGPGPAPGPGTGIPGESIFTGIGRVRASSADDPPATVILSVDFPYDPGDRAFTEELASKIREFRGATADYIASFTAGELGRKAEADIKADLLGKYNSLLRLGRIGILYFNDFMIIE